MVQSYSSQSTQATSFTLRGNQPLLLESTDTTCRLKSGEIAIFATLVNDAAQPYGYRHYLFSVSPGEIIMGAALAYGWEDESRLGLLAVAVKESELQSYPLGKLASKIVDISSQNLSIANSPIALIEQWIAHLGNWLSKLDSPRENLVIGDDQQFLSNAADSTLQPAIWVSHDCDRYNCFGNYCLDYLYQDVDSQTKTTRRIRRRSYLPYCGANWGDF